MFACLPKGHRKLFNLCYLLDCCACCTNGKAEKSAIDPFVAVVSPLKALISDQLESCQTIKDNAVKLKLELFDNDDDLKELEV